MCVCCVCSWHATCCTRRTRMRSVGARWNDWCLHRTATSWTSSVQVVTRSQPSSRMHRQSSSALDATLCCVNRRGAKRDSRRDARSARRHIDIDTPPIRPSLPAPIPPASILHSHFSFLLVCPSSLTAKSCVSLCDLIRNPRPSSWFPPHPQFSLAFAFTWNTHSLYGIIHGSLLTARPIENIIFSWNKVNL